MQSNAKKIYLFSFFWMFLVLMPVIVPFFQSKGLSMEQVYQLQSIFGIGVLLLEIPSGYLCDLWGRKNALLVGTLFSGAGFTYLNWTNSYVDLVVFEVVLSVGMSFVSGADVSLLYDSHAQSSKGDRSKSLANMQFASLTGESVGSLLGGVLASYSFLHVTVAGAISSWIPFFVGLTLKENPREKMSHHSHGENFKAVLRHLFSGGDILLLLTFINTTVWGLSTFFAVWLFQKYWQLNNVPMLWFGALWALFNFSAGVMGKQVHWIEKRTSASVLLISMGFLAICAYLGMGMFSGWFGDSFGILFYLSRGINGVLLKDAMNWKTPAKFRATVNSVQSAFFRSGFAILGPLMGYSIDHWGLARTLNSTGLIFLGLFFITILPLLRAIQRAGVAYIPD